MPKDDLYNLQPLDRNDRVFAAAFHLHEPAVAASYEPALAREPDLRCVEWERRSPFIQFFDVHDAQQQHSLQYSANMPSKMMKHHLDKRLRSAP